MLLLLFVHVCSPLVSNDIHVQYESTHCNVSGLTVVANASLCSEYWKSESGHIEEIYDRGLSLDANHTSSSLNTHRMNGVSRRLRDKDAELHVHVMGGSMTAGRNVHGYEGAWPAVLEGMWRAMRSSNSSAAAQLKVHNHGVGGTSTLWLLDNLGLLFSHGTPVDVVVLDYDINDMVLWTSGRESSVDLLATLELVIYRLLLLEARPAVVYLNVATTHSRVRDLQPQCSEYVMGWQLIRLKEVITRYFDVYTVSQRQAIWSDYLCPAPRGLWDCPGSFCSHPLHKAHGLLAGLMQRFFLKHSSLAPPVAGGERERDSVLLRAMVDRAFLINKTSELDASKCYEFVSHVDVANAPGVMAEFSRRASRNQSDNNQDNSDERRGNYSAVLIARDDCWQYYSDTSGKLPGFINHGLNCTNTSMVFRMRFGVHGTLHISYLRTYNHTAGLALVEVSLLTPGEARGSLSFIPPSSRFTLLGVLDALHKDADNRLGHSLVWPVVFRSPLLENGSAVVRFSLQDANAELFKHKVKVQLARDDPQKVQIYTIGTC